MKLQIKFNDSNDQNNTNNHNNNGGGREIES